jgi:uncharacterized protein DUF3606
MQRRSGLAAEQGDGEDAAVEARVKRGPRPYNNQLVPRDHSRIDLGNASEVAYWCANFRCTGSALRAAVQAVGPSSRAVMQHLQGAGAAGRRIGAGNP